MAEIIAKMFYKIYGDEKEYDPSKPEDGDVIAGHLVEDFQTGSLAAFRPESFICLIEPLSPENVLKVLKTEDVAATLAKSGECRARDLIDLIWKQPRENRREIMNIPRVREGLMSYIGDYGAVFRDRIERLEKSWSHE